MVATHRILSAPLIAAIAVIACASGQNDRAADVAALRAKLEAEAKADRFAGAALLARLENGTPRVLFREAYGLAGREKSIANTIDTRFRIGSMNKMFTATAILQLVQAGKIALADLAGLGIASLISVVLTWGSVPWNWGFPIVTILHVGYRASRRSLPAA